MNDINIEFALYYIVLIIIILFCILVFYVYVIKPFVEEKRYIKSEIKRAYNEKERKYWKKKLKKLYIAYIPIIGRKILKYMGN